ncbi:unnamed protein product, partial [marine sediment metagenome]
TDHVALIKEAKESPGKRKILDSTGKTKAKWVPVEKGREHVFLDYPEIARRPTKIRGQECMEVLVVQDKFNVQGGYLTKASRSVDQVGRPSVSFTFNSRGGKLFGALTSNNLPDPVTDFRRKLGIVLNGYLYSAPGIKSTIHKRGEISGDFTRQQADDLIDVLNAGALPAALSEKPNAEYVTGPSLGRDTIRKGGRAIGVSIVLVLLFMLAYYRFSGMIA